MRMILAANTQIHKHTDTDTEIHKHTDTQIQKCRNTEIQVPFPEQSHSSLLPPNINEDDLYSKNTKTQIQKYTNTGSNSRVVTLLLANPKY